MKKIFNFPSTVLKFVSTIAIAVVLLASVVVAFFGFNAGTDFGNAYQIEINFSDADEYSKYTNATQEVLKANGYSARETKVEDREYDYTMLIRFKAEKVSNSGEMKSAIAQKLEISEDIISIEQISNTAWKYYILNLCIAIIIVLALLFLYGLIRQNWALGISYLLSYLFTLAVGLSVFALTRIEISVISLCILAFFGILTVVGFSFIKTKAEQNYDKVDASGSIGDQFMCVIHNIRKFVFSFFVILTIVLGLLCISGDWDLIYASFAGIASLWIALVSIIFFSCPLYLTFIIKKENKIKKVLSRNKLADTPTKPEKSNKSNKK